MATAELFSDEWWNEVHHEIENDQEMKDYLEAQQQLINDARNRGLKTFRPCVMSDELQEYINDEIDD